MDDVAMVPRYRGWRRAHMWKDGVTPPTTVCNREVLGASLVAAPNLPVCRQCQRMPGTAARAAAAAQDRVRREAARRLRAMADHIGPEVRAYIRGVADWMEYARNVDDGAYADRATAAARALIGRS